jgi:hypothetical protein
MEKEQLRQMLLKINLMRSELEDDRGNDSKIKRLNSIIYDLTELLNILEKEKNSIIKTLNQ